MYKTIILPLAQIDILDAASWYNSRQKGLGGKFTKAIREKVTFIKKNPKASVVRYDKVRTAVLDRFPFMIHYTVDDSKKEILISAVLNTSRDPGIWTTRT